MKKMGRIMLLIVFFVIAMSGVAFAQEDRRGCKDHPMFTRLENFYIYNCEEKIMMRSISEMKKGKK